MSSTRPEFVAVLLAIWRLGATAVRISPAWKRDEVDHALAISGPAHAVGDRPVLAGLMPMLHLDEPITPGDPISGSPQPLADAVLAFSSGTTELPVIACNPLQGARLDSVGRPVPGVELRVVSVETGQPAGPGEVGEIQARSMSLMAGYLPAEATAEAIRDGWYRTEDVGWLDGAGCLRITDRLKEMIKVRGFQVAPAEIETVLSGHPAVKDCAVFGVPDDNNGEAIVAAVAARAAVNPSDLTARVDEKLASYKHLSRVIFVDDIPRLPSGKVLRRVLKESYGCTPDG
jgi:acyl-CoA synthetase (AMP-forming)/AMP-acid ligase II